MELSARILSDLVIYSKYARYLEDKKRRETWEEIIDRNMQMHIKKFPKLEQEIRENYKYVMDKKVLPSMRSLQFSGKPIELNPARIFNCSAIAANRPEIFSEIMFLLLSGCGTGISVQKHHIEELPFVRHPLKKKRRFVVEDSIIGWSEAIKVLMFSYFYNKSDPDFDYSDIRPKGARLVTSGGKAPGPASLKNCIHNVRKILDDVQPGTKLSSLQVFDIVCFIADSVLSGGIRRSSCITLFSIDDDDMLTSKSGSWWELNPQRARSNNSAVLIRHRIKEEQFFKFWERIEKSKTGEPSIFFSNDAESLTNPCFTKENWIHTSEGPRQIKDLIGIPFKVRTNGKDYNVLSNGFLKTSDNKEIVKITTKEGYKIRSTYDHKYFTDKNEWKKISEINIGDKIKINNHRENIKWEGNGTLEEGYLIGHIIGDGHISKKTACCHIWVKDKGSNGIKNFISEIFKNVKDVKKGFRGWNYNFDKTSEILQCVYLKKICDKYNILSGENKKITNEIEKTSSDFHIGFIKGLFDSDGSIQGTQLKGVSNRLSQVKIENLYIAQRMLLRLGINSSIYKNRRKEGNYLLPNSKRENEYYHCQSSHELCIANDNLKQYLEIINFCHEIKKESIEQKLSNYKRNLNKETFLVEIENIEKDGIEDVYDISVENVNSFDCNGFLVHNCGETSLKSSGGFCNLTEINVSDVETQEEINERARVAAFIGTLQASYTNFHYLRDIWKKNAEKESLLGIGMTGIANKNIYNLDLKEAANICLSENERVSKIIGTNKAKRTTLVKPAGTSSSVLGCSSGIHAWHAPYYIRRIRLNKTESLYKYLENKTPNLLEDDFEKPHLGAVLSIPIKSPNGAIFRDESPLELLERVKYIYNNWILPGHREGSNTYNVSCTVSIKDNEWEDVGKWLWENKENYNGIATLPYWNEKYVQMPFEECTKEKYEELLKYLFEIDLSEIKEEEDVTDLQGEQACSGGACDVRKL